MIMMVQTKQKGKKVETLAPLFPSSSPLLLPLLLFLFLSPL
jgi:hypothetical protein